MAAATVTRLLPDRDHELHHIYDSRIPVIGVGEGSWPSLVQELRKLTDLPHETVQQRLNGTRKYGVAFQGWGRRNRDFIHYFTPQQVSYAYHLSADTMTDLLHKSTRARHVDAKVLNITRVEGGAQVEFEGLAPERYDLVFDARGFPRNFIRTGTSTFLSSPPIQPSSAAVRPSSKKNGTVRFCNLPTPVPLPVRTAGYSSSRLPFTHPTGTSSTAIYPASPRSNRTSTRSWKLMAYPNSSNAPSFRFPILFIAGYTTARWLGSATRRPSWNPSKQQRSFRRSCRSGWFSTCNSTGPRSTSSAMLR